MRFAKLKKQQRDLENSDEKNIDFSSENRHKSIKISRKTRLPANIDKRAVSGPSFFWNFGFWSDFGMPRGTQKSSKSHYHPWGSSLLEPTWDQFGRQDALLSILACILSARGSILGRAGLHFQFRGASLGLHFGSHGASFWVPRVFILTTFCDHFLIVFFMILGVGWVGVLVGLVCGSGLHLGRYKRHQKYKKEKPPT